MNNFTSLGIWQLAQNFFFKVHEISCHSALQRDVYVKNELLRASLSIPLFIAEGAGMNKPEEFTDFLQKARGSLDEVCSLLFVLEKIQPHLFPTLALRGEAAEIRLELNRVLQKLRSDKIQNHLDASYGQVRPSDIK